MNSVDVPELCPKCGRDTITRNPAGECYFGCTDDDARVAHYWNTQGPDGVGKSALGRLLAEVRADERHDTLRDIAHWLRSLAKASTQPADYYERAAELIEAARIVHVMPTQRTAQAPRGKDDAK